MTKKAKSKTVKAPDDTGQIKVDGRAATQFKSGQVANPAGRPKGSRVKFGEDFVKQFAEYWEEVGRTALEGLYNKDKRAFVGVAVALLPKLIDVSGNIDHRVYEAIDFDGICKRIETDKHSRWSDKHGEAGRPTRLDS